MSGAFLVVHGHFYQPPRENPWLGIVERQDSARPFHDWYERIAAECYTPNAFARILDADKRSRASRGFGNAIAQAYNHAILPLCNERDRRTQIRWGLADFERRFGRRADAMWLPEAAVSMPTVEAL